MDWTTITSNPVDADVLKLARDYLGHRRTVSNKMFMEYLKDEVSNKRVLDVGVCEHDLSFIDKKNWRHKFLVESSEYCLGIDILDDILNELTQRGYNVKKVDAVSAEDIGERFDVVFIGDVLEHVSRPVDLLLFAKRHLLPKGKIIVTTPNPFYFYRSWEAIRDGVPMDNLDHVSYVTPTSALELGRRAGLELSRYVFFKGSNRFWKYLIKQIVPLDIFSPMYYYEFQMKKEDGLVNVEMGKNKEESQL
ncbi:MAG: methyltransferase domain-containing protein [Bacteroidales bacterium]|nr:methyltransferase domain-containing protein [Bacteroidales bacterium]